MTGVHHLHVWDVSSRSRALSAHIEMTSLTQWQDVLETVSARLENQFDIDHPTLQPELRCVDQPKPA